MDIPNFLIMFEKINDEPMIDVLTQRISFAKITPFKNYTSISCGNDSEGNLCHYPIISKGDSDTFNLIPKQKRKVHHFTTDKEVSRVSLNCLYKNHVTGRNTFETTKQKQISRHYANPFSEIVVITVERSVRIHGDKVTIKLYCQTKSRQFNSIYFRKNFSVTSLTFNNKTGNFTFTKIGKNGRKSHKSFKTNSFNSLKLITEPKTFFESLVFVQPQYQIFEQYIKIFDNVEFTNKIRECLHIDIGFGDKTYTYSQDPKMFLNEFIRKFVEIKKIKTPNGDIEFFLRNFYPTEKYLKKNDRKLIASILDMYGLKTKLTIKLVHETPNIDLAGFIRFCSFFGDDFSKYIGNINKNVFKNSYIILNRESDYNNNKFNLSEILKNKVLLNTQEKENLIKLVHSIPYTSHGALTSRFILILEDHFNMISKIRKYDPNIQMEAKTKKEFDDEHIELSKTISAIHKGWVIEYKFSERMSKDVQRPISLDVNLDLDEPTHNESNTFITYYPVILKREEEYIEEGNFMHHCVATYADKDRSIIISVRTEDNKDRVTCEFDCQTGSLIQARHFCNAQPPAHMEYAILNHLSPRVRRNAQLGLLHASEKLRVPITINGVEVKKEEPTSYLEDMFF